VTKYNRSQAARPSAEGRRRLVTSMRAAGKGMQRFDDCVGARAGIQVRLFGVGGLIQAAVGLLGGVGGLLTKRFGLAWNASSRVCWRAA